jgi:hypothetical protein
MQSFQDYPVTTGRKTGSQDERFGIRNVTGTNVGNPKEGLDTPQYVSPNTKARNKTDATRKAVESGANAGPGSGGKA